MSGMLIPGCQNWEQRKIPPKATAGILDLKDWDLKKEGPVSLKGEWKFKWLEDSAVFSEPGYDDSGWETFQVPDFWNEITGKQFGYGWFRLKIINISQKGLGLFLKDSQTSYKIYVNNQVVLQNGSPGNSKSTTIPQFLSLLSELPDNNTLIIAWKISNFHNTRGGPEYSPRLGIFKNMDNEYKNKDLLDMFILGILIMMFLYHIVIWFFRPVARAGLFFGCFCLVIFLRTIADYHFISRFLFHLNVFELQAKLNLFSLPAGCLLFAAFLYRLYPVEFRSPVLKLLGFINLPLIAIILFTPRWIHGHLLYICEATLILACFWFLITLIMATRNKKEYASMILVGVICINVAIINDIIVDNFPLLITGMQTRNLLQIITIIFIFIQSVALSMKYAKSINTSEYLSANLMEEVDKKTVDLLLKNKEIKLINSRLKELDIQKSQFFQNITHEFRTPLTMITGPLDSILPNLPPDQEELKNQLSMVNRNSRQLLYLINQLLDLSKLEAGQAQLKAVETDIILIIREISGYFDSVAMRKGIRFTFSSEVDSVKLYLDRDKFKKILSNLLSNAFKFTGEKGRIKISLSVVQDRGGTGEQVIRLLVEDTGIGINADDLPFIFQRFRQSDGSTTREYGGTGIGLSIVKEYTELHGGKVEVASEKGKGSKFTLVFPTGKDHLGPEKIGESGGGLITPESLLPRVETPVNILNYEPEWKNGENDPDSSSGEKPAASRESNKKILVVEDNPEMRRYLKSILKPFYQIIEAKNGEEGWQQVKSMQPDLVLCDIMMPKMDGNQLLRMMRQDNTTGHIPLIMLTAKASADLRIAGLEAGADDYLSKPFNPRELIIRVKNLFKRSIHKFPSLPVLLLAGSPAAGEEYASQLLETVINNIMICTDPKKIQSLLAMQPVAGIILDTAVKNLRPLFDNIRKECPGTPVIVITENENIEQADYFISRGAYEFLIKPVSPGQLELIIKHGIQLYSLQKEINTLKSHMFSEELKHPEAFTRIITNNESMMNIFKYMEAVAESPKPVLITGESGVGKELIAETIHRLSKREGEFVTVNIAGLDDNMFSDTLFGHKIGSFTGAQKDRAGLIKRAEGGTIFLDEIGDLTPRSQVKLLRLLQEDEYYTIGSDQVEYSTARIIAATNACLSPGQEEGSFRCDLFYRLTTHQIGIPPLRERLEDDLPFLLEHFVAKAAATLEKEKPRVPEVLYRQLESYHFPGNIRELETMVFNVVNICKSGTLPVNEFRKYIEKNSSGHKIRTDKEEQIISISTSSGEFPRIKDIKKYLIREALKKTNGNQSAAARLLGISQSSLSLTTKKRKKDV